MRATLNIISIQEGLPEVVAVVMAVTINNTFINSNNSDNNKADTSNNNNSTSNNIAKTVDFFQAPEIVTENLRRKFSFEIFGTTIFFSSKYLETLGNPPLDKSLSMAQ